MRRVHMNQKLQAATSTGTTIITMDRIRLLIIRVLTSISMAINLRPETDLGRLDIDICPLKRGE